MSRIPKRIVQTGTCIPQRGLHKAAITNLRLLNQDFDYWFFDDAAVEAFVNREYPEYRKTFDAYRVPIQKYDFFRYLAIYKHGGFYFDLDVLTERSLEPLTEADCVFPFEGLTFSRLLRDRYDMDWQIGNYAFGAVAGHPFLKAVIENCVRAQKDPEWVAPMMKGVPRFSRTDFLVLNTTGPGLLSRTLAESSSLARTVTILFPDDVCDRQNWNRFGDVGVHLMDGTWRHRSGLVRSRLANYSEAAAMHRIVREARTRGKTRTHVGNGRCANVELTPQLT